MTKKKIVKQGNLIIDQRTEVPGRRTTDRHCPFYPDNCRDVVATKEELIPMNICLKDLKEMKLPSWVFKLFVGTFIPICIVVLGWVGWSTYENLKVTTRLETNQVHLMEAWNIPVAVKPPDSK